MSEFKDIQNKIQKKSMEKNFGFFHFITHLKLLKNHFLQFFLNYYYLSYNTRKLNYLFAKNK
jgi:hypothetical protein